MFFECLLCVAREENDKQQVWRVYLNQQRNEINSGCIAVSWRSVLVCSWSGSSAHQHGDDMQWE